MYNMIVTFQVMQFTVTSTTSIYRFNTQTTNCQQTFLVYTNKCYNVSTGMLFLKGCNWYVTPGQSQTR